MSESACLKLARATKHIAELSEFLKKERPFTYFLEANARTGYRALFAKKNEVAIGNAGLIAGDIVHNARSALDHAYWKVVGPVATGDRQQGSVQFPFSKTAEGLQAAIENRLAHKVSRTFFQKIYSLKPHGEEGGNEFLYMIHELDIINRHKLLVPVGEWKRLSSDIVQQQVPEFPSGFNSVGLGDSLIDVVWNAPAPMREMERRKRGFPSFGPIEVELDVPLDIVFYIRPGELPRPFVSTLHQLVDMARTVIGVIAS